MTAFLGPALVASLLLVTGANEKGYLGVHIRLDTDSGAVMIQTVVGNTPAEKAGLMSGDLILKANGTEVEELPKLVGKIRNTQLGHEIKLLIRRDGKDREIKVKVGKLPDPDGN